ncbi:MAG: hypothetical protein JST89_04255 [Cyanobacteria bacterium SZAS-4]|nr:hypothetical protein [Cyanobacteria bacterium SZAS-4]
MYALLSDPFTPARHEIVELLVAIAIGYTEYYIPDGFPVEDFRRKVDDGMRASFLKHSSIAVRGAAAIAAAQNNQQAEIIAPFCKLQSLPTPLSANMHQAVSTKRQSRRRSSLHIVQQ